MCNPSFGHFRLIFQVCLFLPLFTVLSSCNPVGKQSELQFSNDPEDSKLTLETSHSWDFTNSAQYLVSDNDKIAISSGAVLQKIDQTHNSNSDFNGTHAGTLYESSKLTLPNKNTSSYSVEDVLPSRATSLVGHWKMENNFQDSSGRNHHANKSGDTTFSSDSQLGNYAASFDGTDDKLTVPHHSDFVFTTNITISTWVYFSQNDTYAVIIDKPYSSHTSPYYDYHLRFSSTSGVSPTLTAYFRVGSHDPNDSLEITDLGHLYDTWSHIVATYDGNDIKVYINGDLIGTKSNPGTLDNSSQDLHIGGFGNLANGDLAGKIDELAMWNITLNASEVFEIYRQQGRKYIEHHSDWTPQWSSLVGYWKMNGSWKDSVSSNHGTVSGAGNDTTFDQNAKVGSHSATFDGTSDFISTASPISYGHTQWSACAWVKAANGSTRRFIFETSPRYTVSLAFQTNGTLQAHTLKQGYVGHQSCSTASRYDDDAWHFTCTTVEDGDLSVYVDGDLKTCTGGSTLGADTITSFKIGTYRDSNGRWFDGNIDEVSFWNVKLEKHELDLIYHRQKQKYSGLYTAPVMDTGLTSSTWTSKSWKTELPFLKELPGSAGSESSTNYSSIITNSLMNGVEAYWRFNEEVANSVPGGTFDFEDFSGNSNHANEVGGVGFATSGIFTSSAKFNGSSQYAATSSSTFALGNNFTICAWAKVDVDVGSGNRDTIYSQGNAVDQPQLELGGQGTNRVAAIKTGAWIAETQDNVVRPGTWQHFCYTRNGVGAGTHAIYVDGISQTLITNSSSNFADGPSTKLIGSRTTSTQFFDGSIDELVVWSRALSPIEIAQLYRRGANRIKIQIRSCDDSSCSGETWLGPDGTATTWFSELNNCDMILGPTGLCDFYAGGKVNLTTPSIIFSDFTSIDINPNRYFQYRVLMESDMESTSPTLSSISIGPAHYHHDSPSVTTLSGPPFSLWRGFSAETSGDCSVSYQVSLDKSIWYHHNGSSWEIASSISQASSAANLNKYATTFHREVGSGRLYIKAILQSDGTQSCIINSMKADLTRSIPSSHLMVYAPLLFQNSQA